MNSSPSTNSSFTQVRMIGTVGLGLVGLRASSQIAKAGMPATSANEHRKSYEGSLRWQNPTLGLVKISGGGNSAILTSAVVQQAASSYRKFAASQIPLEADFARVLASNLWNLYSR